MRLKMCKNGWFWTSRIFKLISHKIWGIEKSWNFHIVRNFSTYIFFFQYIYHSVVKHEILFHWKRNSSNQLFSNFFSKTLSCFYQSIFSKFIYLLIFFLNIFFAPKSRTFFFYFLNLFVVTKVLLWNFFYHFFFLSQKVISCKGHKNGTNFIYLFSSKYFTCNNSSFMICYSF